MTTVFRRWVISETNKRISAINAVLDENAIWQHKTIDDMNIRKVSNSDSQKHIEHIWELTGIYVSELIRNHLK